MITVTIVPTINTGICKSLLTIKIIIQYTEREKEKERGYHRYRLAAKTISLLIFRIPNNTGKKKTH